MILFLLILEFVLSQGGSCDTLNGNADCNNGTCTLILPPPNTLGICFCNSGYLGSNCEDWLCYGTTNTDSGVCSNHGSCISPDSCLCDDDYYGNVCELWDCNGTVYTNDGEVCSNHGSCISPDSCLCDSGYYEDECELWNCFGTVYTNDEEVCNNRGTCISPDVCYCDDFYSGLECLVYYCDNIFFDDPSVCTGHGECTLPNNCVCDNDYFGSDCELWNCFGTVYLDPNVCSGHGNCTSPDTCICEPGYEETCDTWLCNGILNNETNVCDGHGSCSDIDNCSCDLGYYGLDCEFSYYCFGKNNEDVDVCSSNGVCLSNDTCACNYPYYGQTCDLYDCYGINFNDSNVCSGRGECIDPKINGTINHCLCEAGYSNGCEKFLCNMIWNFDPAVCNGKGNCTDIDTCECNSEYYGDSCENWDCYGINNTDIDVCSGNGSCISPESCFCDDYYFGDICETFNCYKIPNSQNIWSWISGSNTIYQTGVYGTKGVPHLNNIPGSRYGHQMINIDGNIFLNGGKGFDASNLGYLNDLWKYNFSISQWTWLSGSNTINNVGIYGIKQVYGPYIPSSRYNHQIINIDGDIHLYGGYGYIQSISGDFGYHNDLWKYDSLIDQWMWMYGSEELNEFAYYANGLPGSRESHQMITIDGNIYMHGGIGHDETNFGLLNGLWKYLSQFGWEKLSGSDYINAIGRYGTKGVPHLDNAPGSRFGHQMINIDGNIFLHGGKGYDEGFFSYLFDPGYLNDLWKYNISTTLWTWMSGGNIIDQAGVYGINGVSHIDNVPGSRYEHQMLVFDEDIFLHGGLSYNNVFNDLWKYDFSNDEWTWMSGSNITNQFGVYGIKGVSHIDNIPGSRHSHQMITIDENIFLNGGNFTLSLLNDLWKYVIPKFCTLNCTEGWYGDQCEIPICNPSCINGNCVSPGICNCTEGWDGDLCDNIMYVIPCDLNCTLNCGINGECVITETFEKVCLCDNGWTGDYCSEKTKYCEAYENNIIWNEINQTGTKQNETRDHSMVIDKTNQIIYLTGGFPSFLDILFIYNISSNTWININMDPHDRYGHQMVIDEGNQKLYLFSGYTGRYEYDLWVYDIFTNLWTNITSIGPSARFKHQMVIDEDNQKLYMFGGFDATGLKNDLWVYDIFTNLWTNITSSGPSRRYIHQMVIDEYNQKLYMFGGFDDSGFKNDLWIYDIESSSWSNITSNAPSERCNHAMNIDKINKKIYVFGGDIPFKNDLWVYDIPTNVWVEIIQTDDIPSERSGHSMVIDFINQNIYVFGGFGNTGFKNDLWLGHYTEICVECPDSNCTCPIYVCDLNCNNGECVFNETLEKVCLCENGWTGSICDIPICNPSCINGNCTSPGVCNCTEGWDGDQCDNIICNPSCINGDCIAWNTCNCSDCYYGNYCQDFNKTCELCQIGNECIFNCSLICGVNGECVVTELNEQCNCLDGWTGSSCNTPICNPVCINGNCTSPGVCTCNTGWTGNLCDIPLCSPSCVNGYCTGPNICTCDSNWSGPSCETPNCVPSCVNGTCVAPDHCQCDAGYTSNDCSVPTCYGIPQGNVNVCHGNGTCDDVDLCSCDTNYYGDMCNEWDCFGYAHTDINVCNEHGICHSPDDCDCDYGWDGDECQIILKVIWKNVKLKITFYI